MKMNKVGRKIMNHIRTVCTLSNSKVSISYILCDIEIFYWPKATEVVDGLKRGSTVIQSFKFELLARWCQNFRIVLAQPVSWCFWHNFHHGASVNIIDTFGTISTMVPVSIHLDTWHSHICHWSRSSACKGPTNKAWNTMLTWLKFIKLLFIL